MSSKFASRKSMGGAPSPAKSTKARRQTFHKEPTSKLDESENNANNANKRRYSIKTPEKSMSGIAGEGTSSLPDLSEVVCKIADQSCISIYSEEDTTSKSVTNTSALSEFDMMMDTEDNGHDSRRNTFAGVPDLSISNLDASADSRRNTMEQADIHAFLDEQDEEEVAEEVDADVDADARSLAQSLQLSMSSTSSIRGTDFLDGTEISVSESNLSLSFTASDHSSSLKRGRKSTQSTASSGSLSTTGSVVKSATNPVTAQDLLLFSPEPRATRSSSRNTTPVRPVKDSAPSSVVKSASKSTAKSATKSAAKSASQSPAASQNISSLIDLDVSVSSASLPRRSPRRASRAASTADSAVSTAASRVATPNFLDTTNTASVNLDNSLLAGVNQSLVFEAAEEVDSSAFDEDVTFGFGKRSAQKKRRETVENVELDDLLAELDSSNVTRDGNSRRETVDLTDIQAMMELDSSRQSSDDSVNKSADASLNSSALNTSAQNTSALNDGILNARTHSARVMNTSVSKASPATATGDVDDQVSISSANTAGTMDTFERVQNLSAILSDTPEQTPSKSPARSSRRSSRGAVAQLDAQDATANMSELSGLSSSMDTSAVSLSLFSPSGKKSKGKPPPAAMQLTEALLQSASKADVSVVVMEMEFSTTESPAAFAITNARRNTVDPADMSALMADLSADQSTMSGFDGFNGRDSIATITLMHGIARTFEAADQSNLSESLNMSELEAQAAGQPIAHSADSAASSPSRSTFTMSSFNVSVAASRVHESAKGTKFSEPNRRETADFSRLNDLLDDEESQSDALLVLSTSNLSAHSRSYNSSKSSSFALNKSDSSFVRAERSVYVAAENASGTENEEREVPIQRDTELSAHEDDAATVNTCDMDILNDTMSTAHSINTVGTMYLENLVEALIEERNPLGNDDSDADSDITGGTMAPLCDFLMEYTDHTAEEVQQLVLQEQQRHAADALSDAQSDADSVRSGRSDRSERSTKSGKPSRLSVSKSGASSTASSASKRKQVTSPASSVRSANSSMDSLGSLASLGHSASLSRGRLPLRKNGRQSLSTSTVPEEPHTKKSKVRHSLGLIATTAAPTVSSAGKSKVKVHSAVAGPSKATPVIAKPLAGPAVAAPVIIAPAVAAAAASAALNSSMSMAPPGSALKSCLSTRKQRPVGMRFDLDTSITASAMKRNVIFGSPQACEFNKTSPTTNFTPLHHDTAKSLFSMAAAGEISEGEDSPVDPVTEENDRILEEWDRLSNASGGCGSDSDEESGMGLDEFPFDIDGEQSEAGSRRSSHSGASTSSRRRKSMLQPMLDLDHSDHSDRSSVLDTSVNSIGDARPALAAQLRFEPQHEVLDTSAEMSVDVPYVINMEGLNTSTSQLDDATGTVMLPASLADVIILNNAPAVPVHTAANVSTCSEGSVEHTEQIEMNLGDLMRKLTAESQPQDADMSVASDNESDGGSHRMSILEGMYMSVGDLSASQHEDEGALGSLIGRHSDASTIRTEGRLSTDSVHSQQSQRSTRSRRSSVGSVASVASVASDSAVADTSSVKSIKSKGKRGKKTAAVESPAAAEVDIAVEEPAVEMSLSNIHDLSTQSQDHTFGLEGSLGALMSTLGGNMAAAPVTTNTTVAALLPQEAPQWSSEQEISVIVADQEYNDDLECDFSALESPRRSTMVRVPVAPDSEQSQLSARASVGVSRRSTRSRPKESLSFDTHSDITHETFGDFNLTSEDDQMPSQGSLMDRLRNLNKGARSNTLLQAGAPTVRAESRMSIGIKRKSMLNTTNLNSSLNMSVLPAAAVTAPSAVKSAVKSAKKSRKEESSPVKAASPTPSMSNVYGGSPTSIRYNQNPMRLQCIAEQGAPAEHSILSTSDSEGADVSVLNKTTTNYEDITQNLRTKLYAFFAAAQTLRTLTSTFSAEVQGIVRSAMVNNIPAAYVDTPLSQVPVEGLLLAFELSAAQAEDFTSHVIATYPEAVKHQRVAFKSADADQLWVNMTAATILSNTAALKAAHTDSSDKFYQKVLNKALAEPTSSSASAAAKLTAQQAAELSRVQSELVETTLLTDILNKLTYCRVTTFTTQCIKVLATLSPTVAATLVFNIGRSENALVVEDIEVDLLITQDRHTSTSTTSQNLFVSAYFASLMCADELDGCLSGGVLDAIKEPCHIPALLHKISGSIAELRWALLKLSLLSADQWKYSVNTTAPQFGGYKIVISQACGAGKQPLQCHIPVRCFVQASSGSTTDAFTLDESEVVFAYADINKQVHAQEAADMLSTLQTRLSSTH